MLTRRTAALAALGGALLTCCATPEVLKGAGAFRASKKFVRTDGGLRMAYYEAGKGAPIVFLHGNPTSSYLWRNVIPHLTGRGRCIAPDLIGMGDSDKLPQSGPGKYTFFEHSRRLDALLRAVGAQEAVTLVVHDWGGPLGFHWAKRNESRVKAIVFMETFLVSQNASNSPPFALEFFSRFRTAEAERDVLINNAFVETIFLGQFQNMPEEDRAEYRRPFVLPGESRRPTLEWPRQVPINGDPADVDEATLGFLSFMAKTQIPKLFIRGDPGALVQGGRENIPRGWPRVQEAVVPGRHFLPEESGDAIGRLSASWLASLNR